jgi:NADH-quinone oxidoreductase subunit G
MVIKELIERDVILPGSAYTEKDGTDMNLEGRAQFGYRAVQPPGDATDREVLVSIANRSGFKTHQNISDLREEIVTILPFCSKYG